MLPAVRFYTYSKRFEEAYTAAMRPLTEELDMAQPAVDILLFLANNPGMDTARDICTYRHLKPAIVSFHVEKLAGEGYNVGKINVDDEGELAERYHVMNIPTLIIFKNGEEKERMVGVQSKDLLESKLKALA